MKLPNGNQAVVDIAKLRDYCLDPGHWRGQHKARVFATALGITADDAELLRYALLAAAAAEDATATDKDEHGQRYLIDFMMTGPAGRAQVRSGWIIRSDEDIPRLATCFVL